MKNLFFLTAAVALTAVFAGCARMDAPDGLGKISFASTQTWTVTSGTVTQTWSDAVVAAGADGKTTFDASKADWRNNPGYKGTLFSWEAVNKYKDKLCPDGWRVPTYLDFMYLDLCLGGTGEHHYIATVIAKYTNPSVWGGQYNGGCAGDGTLLGQGVYGEYWTQEFGSSIQTYSLFFSLGGGVTPGIVAKWAGLTVRCVKN